MGQGQGIVRKTTSLPFVKTVIEVSDTEKEDSHEFTVSTLGHSRPSKIAGRLPNRQTKGDECNGEGYEGVWRKPYGIVLHFWSVDPLHMILG